MAGPSAQKVLSSVASVLRFPLENVATPSGSVRECMESLVDFEICPVEAGFRSNTTPK